MNIDLVKNEIEQNINSRVKVKVNGLRNRTNVYVGNISAVYPNIFTVQVEDESKSFSYAEVITGEVELTYM